MVEPGERGATRVADRVVAKIAAEAAREALRGEPGLPGAPYAPEPHPVDEAVEADEAHEAADGPAGAYGPQGPPDGEPRPRAAVVVRGRVARVRVAVTLGYPSDIGARCHAVRRHVTERVRALAGMEVPEVAVTVERLRSPALDRTARERVR
ncbi:hypothetical protein RKE29_29255 [Streptomyces sp. B1866]|uniref:hypothetical protein n=1 Tax=Streptomyces sp. B1866 TaxID=3075431 RepID=UPI0028906AA7|nr:hypothetical protein [Streptomyces sp. B1866]MDT3400642.1 hypothetical protein [Streptomyces sp. B1866]